VHMYLNHRSILQCTHGGRVLLIPPPYRSFHIMQSPVVTDMDLLKAPIIGCPQVGPGLKPCTRVVSIIMGRSLQFYVDGQVPLLDSLMALTDGVAPGMVAAIYNGGSNATPAPISIQALSLANASASGAALCEICR